MILFLSICSFRAGETFCQMACGMLASIGDFLRMGIDEIVKNMYELSDNDEDEDMATRFGANLYTRERRGEFPYKLFQEIPFRGIPRLPIPLRGGERESRQSNCLC